MIEQAKPCPIRGCRRRCQGIQIMCAEHWQSLPRHYREAVWLDYGLAGADEVAHERAILQAITVAQGIAYREERAS